MRLGETTLERAMVMLALVGCGAAIMLENWPAVLWAGIAAHSIYMRMRERVGYSRREKVG